MNPLKHGRMDFAGMQSVGCLSASQAVATHYEASMSWAALACPVGWHVPEKFVVLMPDNAAGHTFFAFAGEIAYDEEVVYVGGASTRTRPREGRLGV